MGSDGKRPRSEPCLPQAVPIDSYGNGGFRFGGLSHRGSLLALPSGVHGWSVDKAQDITLESLRLVLEDAGRLDFLALGTGAKQIFPSPEIFAAMTSAGISLEAMDTGAALNTYNILLAEGRRAGAALIAVA